MGLSESTMCSKYVKEQVESS